MQYISMNPYVCVYVCVGGLVQLIILLSVFFAFSLSNHNQMKCGTSTEKYHSCTAITLLSRKMHSTHCIKFNTNFNEKIINRVLCPSCSLYLNISSGNFEDWYFASYYRNYRRCLWKCQRICCVSVRYSWTLQDTSFSIHCIIWY